MNPARALRLVAAVVPLTLLPWSAAHAQTVLDRQLRANQARLDSIRNERRGLEDQLTHLRGRIRNISSELTNLERQKAATGRIVNELDRQMSGLTAQLDTITLDLVLAQNELAEKRALQKRRIVEIYKRGPLWTFQVLLAAESFSDLISRYKYLYLVSRQDQALVTDVEALRNRIAKERHDLTVVQQQLGENRDERARELERYARLERQRQSALRVTRSNAQAANARLGVLARDEQRLTSLISDLERRRREAIASGRAPVSAPTITAASAGRLDWPVTGNVLYDYGPAPGPDKTTITYQGIGIAAKPGTPVHVVADGRVEVAGPMETYGLGVVVDHGGGVYTLYLYLSRIDVKSGQLLRRGDVVGRSGGQASDHGPHIEFQIRQVPEGSTAALSLDPLNWLKKRR